MAEIYICTSIEIDGPIPGPHSIRSLGSAAFDRNGELLSSFSVNLQRLRGARPHPEILARWRSMRDAWAVVTHEPETPGPAIHDYLRWLKGLPAQKVFVGYPAAVPFMFVEWYLHHFTGSSPFRRAALDLRSYAMVLLQTPYHRTNKRRMPTTGSATIRPARTSRSTTPSASAASSSRSAGPAKNCRRSRASPRTICRESSTCREGHVGMRTKC